MKRLKHESELFFRKFTILNAYIYICIIQNKYKIYNSHVLLASTEQIYLWMEASNYTLLLFSRENDKKATKTESFT